MPLRRGMPAVIGASPPLVLLAAETADAAGLARFRRIAMAPPVLLVSANRAAALVGGVPASHAVALDAAGLALHDLQALADPTLPAVLPMPLGAAVPDGAEAALALAVLARLLPAVLAAPAPGRTGISPP